MSEICKIHEYPKDEYHNCVDTLEEYKSIVRKFDSLKQRAEDIACVVCPRQYGIYSLDEEDVTYQYNNSCGCHPEEAHGYFPSAWLFDPDWKIKWEEKKKLDKEREERYEAEKKAKVQRYTEERERQMFEQLKKKFENDNV